MCLNHGSLFSGIGGFDLAAEWAGFENIFQVEIDDYCQKVLKKNFPNVKKYKDIKEFDGTKYRGAVDIITGGFPCQPYSIAGKQKGAGDHRNLWPEMFRIIKEIRPAWIVGENVANIVNFVEFDNILSDLETENYEVQTFIIPAVAVDARHRRDRVWILGTASEHNRSSKQKREYKGTKIIDGCCKNKLDAGTTLSFAKKKGLERSESARHSCADGLPSELCEGVANTQDSGTVRRIGTQTDVTEKFGQRSGAKDVQWWPVEPSVGRVAYGIPNRVDRLKGLGNAIVPQVALKIFETIRDLSK